MPTVVFIILACVIVQHSAAAAAAGSDTTTSWANTSAHTSSAASQATSTTPKKTLPTTRITTTITAMTTSNTTKQSASRTTTLTQTSPPTTTTTTTQKPTTLTSRATTTSKTTKPPPPTTKTLTQTSPPPPTTTTQQPTTLPSTATTTSKTTKPSASPTATTTSKTTKPSASPTTTTQTSPATTTTTQQPTTLPPTAATTTPLATTPIATKTETPTPPPTTTTPLATTTASKTTTATTPPPTTTTQATTTATKTTTSTTPPPTTTTTTLATTTATLATTTTTTTPPTTTKPTTTTAKPPDCKNPPESIANSTWNTTRGISYKSNADYTCNSGYNMTGNNTIECQEHGVWSSPTFHCTLEVIGYGGRCDSMGPDAQCTTRNASCINVTCACNSSRQYVKEEGADRCDSRPVLPKEPKPTTSSKANAIDVVWGSNFNVLDILVNIQPKNTHNQSEFRSDPVKNSVTITNLTSGTLYNIEVKVARGSITSEDSHNLSSYTKPEPLIGAERTFQNVTEHSLTVLLTPGSNKGFDKYQLRISPPPTDRKDTYEINRNDQESYPQEFSSLIASTTYTVSVTVIAGNFTDTSTEPLHISTLPAMVKQAEVTDRHNNSLQVTVYYEGGNKENIQYRVNVNDSLTTIVSQTNCRDEHGMPETISFVNATTFKVTQLKSGTNYTMEIYTCLDGISSESAYPLASFTRPQTPSNLHIVSLGDSILTVNWSVKHINPNEQIVLDITPRPTTTVSLPYIISKNQTVSGIQMFNNLSAGTEYTVSAFTIIDLIVKKGNEINNEPIRSEGNDTVTSYTRPLRPTISITYKSETSLHISAQSKSYFKQLQLLIDGMPNRIIEITKGTGNVSGLTMGTEYNMTFFTMIDELKSLDSTNKTAYTRPGPPKHPDITLKYLHETSMSITWTPPEDGQTDRYCTLLSDQTKILKNWTCVSSVNTTRTYDKLTPGKHYTIYITTEWKSLRCIRNASVSTYTRPYPPGSIVFQDIKRKSLTIDIPNRTWDVYRFLFSPSLENGQSSITINSSRLPKNITDCKTGTKYNISAYSIVGGIASERVTIDSTYTRPGTVANITADLENTNESALYINWDKPTVGHSDSFQLHATCKSPNTDTHMMPNMQQLVNTSSAMLSDLDPGTFCKVTISVIINNARQQLFGENCTQTIDIGSREAAPGVVTVVTSETTNQSLTFSWNKPSKPNGVVRQYRASVIDKKSNCTLAKYVYNDKINSEEKKLECQGEDIPEPSPCDSPTHVGKPLVISTQQQMTENLHPYRNYSVIIQAFTKCWGKTVTTPLHTKIGVPSVSPTIIINKTTESSIQLIWKPLDELEEGNGPITDYTIRTSFSDSVCSEKHESNMTKTNTSATANITLKNLRPYWNYEITISASTSVGEGNQSEQKTFKTDESYPGMIKSTINVSHTKTREAAISWLPPCRTNGVITKYNLTIHNNDTDTTKHVISSQDTKTVIRELDPYSNYTVDVAAYTKIGPGHISARIPFRTKLGVPKEPKSVTIKSSSSDTLLVTWTAPRQYTGPTNYSVTAIDQKSEKIKFYCYTGYNFNATSCIVTKLDAYWRYSVYVTANTGAGTTKSKNTIGITKQSTPGKVSLIILNPEDEVTAPRSMNISWAAPAERDLNGNITKYYIQYTNTGADSMTRSTSTENNVKWYVVKHIQPGNYTVTVFAATYIGNGTQLSNTTVVNPGAPLKLEEETGGILLMQPGNSKVSDDERQISVQLPLEKLLCNPRSGRLTRWGVIVSESSQATDSPFFGDTQQFKEKVAATYKSWFEVKDMDSIPPYIATPLDWKVVCQTNSGQSGNRRRRSALPQYQEFVVGEAGTCSNKPSDQYCNGQLQPGRSYRVKSFACTEGGCTETKYSQPINTTRKKIKEADPTVPIAAGISSGVVVLAIICAVIFYLKRKQKACFEKDIETDTHTHRHGNEIHMDKIETTKRKFFRPGAMKLSDFPESVYNMHKDSDLLFADAYKMLKDKSPNHPMTAAEQQCCRPKNRYTNILAFDHSRVKLRPSDDIDGSDYINANYIPGYTSRREYIATQGPMQATFDDFWRMVWEQNVDTIVMLTKLMEKGRHKCDKYWPDLSEPVFYGDLVVTLQSESNLSDYTIKIFEIKMGIKMKKIKHFHFLQWPDFGCPEKHWPVINFISMVRQYRPPFPKGPLLVHCSAGVGRTGTFIAVDYLLQHIRDHDEVDIYNLVLDMRNHRLNMVQTEDQYVYIHECLKAFVTTDEDDEDEEDDDENLYENTSAGVQEENVYENTGFSKE